jgi:hypothetical protein
MQERVKRYKQQTCIGTHRFGLQPNRETQSVQSQGDKSEQPRETAGQTIFSWVQDAASAPCAMHMLGRVAKSRMCTYTLYIHIRYIYAVYDKNTLFWAYTYVPVDIVYIRQNGVYIRYIPYVLSVTSQAVAPLSAIGVCGAVCTRSHEAVWLLKGLQS